MEEDLDDHLTVNCGDDWAMCTAIEAKSMRTECDVASDIFDEDFDEVTDDKAEMFAAEELSADTDRDVTSEIFDLDFDEATDDTAEYENMSRFTDNSAKTDCDVGSNIFEEVFDEKVVVKDVFGRQHVKLCYVLFNKRRSTPRVFM